MCINSLLFSIYKRFIIKTSNLETRNCGKKIASANIVSFDVFDTLLLRPVLSSVDLFSFLKEMSVDIVSKNVYADRAIVEKELKNPTIDTIYQKLGEKHNLSIQVIEELKQKELDLEFSLSYPRSAGKKLYELAVAQGKKIIATSDMYLPSEFIRKLLVKSGYDKVSEVFVSCECGTTKYSGGLYHVVNQRVLGSKKAKNILHIGDNFYSDYVQAKREGWSACYVPNVVEYFENSSKQASLWMQNLKCDASTRLVLGYAINAASEERLLSAKKGTLDIKQFASLFVAPMLYRASDYIINNTEIQTNYNTIDFVSRDGYLPIRAYNYLRDKLGRGIPGQYVYASRLAYDCFIDNDPYGELRRAPFPSKYCLKDYIDHCHYSDELKRKLFENLTTSELSLPCYLERKSCISALKRIADNDIQSWYERKRSLARRYYRSSMKPKEGRTVVYDTGYHGSISKGLLSAYGDDIKVDKVYIWTKHPNEKNDQKNGTKTFSIDGYLPADWWASIWEIVMSEISGSCIGFCEDEGIITPKTEELRMNSLSIDSLMTIQGKALADYERFLHLMRENLDNVHFGSYAPLRELFNIYLDTRSKKATAFLDGISFVDSAYDLRLFSIGELIRKHHRSKLLKDIKYRLVLLRDYLRKK